MNQGLATSIRRVVHATVKRNSSPLWYVLGWRRVGTTYIGFYRARGRQWVGELQETGIGTFAVFIERAPASIVNGPHSACFHKDYARSTTKKPVYSVHQSPNPRSPEEAIHAVEKILAGVN
jgi:hypothetical protein